MKYEDPRYRREVPTGRNIMMHILQYDRQHDAGESIAFVPTDGITAPTYGELLTMEAVSLARRRGP